MSTTNLQVPIRKELKIAATEAALAQGFSSLQEAVRIFLGKLAQGTVEVVFAPKTIQLSPKAIKRYNRMAKDMETGKGWHKAKNVEDLMRQLNA